MQEERLRELETLKEIAETLNSASDMDSMLGTALRKLLILTGLQTGWVFLMEKGGEAYSCAADRNLPPALAMQGKRPMCEGDCWCIDRFRDGRLDKAINILNCKRLENAVVCRTGDTGGITHHATIPLRSGSDLFGILNVASPGVTSFSEEKLALLQSVAYQIGTAAHRIRLFDRERKRAGLYERLGMAAGRLSARRGEASMAGEIVHVIGDTLGWPYVALYREQKDGLYLYARYQRGEVDTPVTGGPVQLSGPFRRAFAELRTVPLDEGSSQAGCRLPVRSGAAVPLVVMDRPYGLLVAGGFDRSSFDDIDTEVLEALSSHVSLAFENQRLQEQSQALARWEERNRIARDLHDSVSQMLFSLQLHARGLEAMLAQAPGSVSSGAGDIGRLSREALAEMRSMIRQLRPAGLEEGLLTGLARYGAKIGLQVDYETAELRRIPADLEEALWRIGQEALNNASKHAGVDRVAIRLAFLDDELCMTVSDRGTGIARDDGGQKRPPGYGMTTMRERAEAVGGSVAIRSREGGGTDVVVRLPLDSGEMAT